MQGNDIAKRLGANIAVRRQHAGLTQERLAAKLDITADPTATPPAKGDMLSSVATGLPVGIITKTTKTRGNKQLMTYSIEAMAWSNFTGA